MASKQWLFQVWKRKRKSHLSVTKIILLLIFHQKHYTAFIKFTDVNNSFFSDSNSSCLSNNLNQNNLQYIIFWFQFLSETRGLLPVSGAGRIRPCTRGTGTSPTTTGSPRTCSSGCPATRPTSPPRLGRRTSLFTSLTVTHKQIFKNRFIVQISQPLIWGPN